MFTGLVKEIGTVIEISKAVDSSYNLAVESAAISKGAAMGDSVAVNGVCLTVTKKKRDVLFFDCMEETVRRTSLGELRVGDPVNLEEPLKPKDAIGGHFVLGHVDCVGKIIDITRRNSDASMEISIPKEFGGLLVEKGSVAVDGVSLTTGNVKENGFTVYLVPHTLRSTTLGSKKIKSVLNVEFDIIGKYVLRQKTLSNKKGLTEEFLKERGFR